MSQETTNPSTFKTTDGVARVRKSDGAVYVDGLGYVTELPTLGSRKVALEAARKALAEGQSKQAAGTAKTTKATTSEREKLGFG